MTEGPQPLLNLLTERKKIYYRPICYFGLYVLVRVYSLTNFINLTCSSGSTRQYLNITTRSCFIKTYRTSYVFIVLKKDRAFDIIFFSKKNKMPLLSTIYESLLNIWFDDTRKITLLGGTISLSIKHSRVIHLSWNTSTVYKWYLNYWTSGTRDISCDHMQVTKNMLIS